MPGRSFAQLRLETHWADSHRCAGWFTTPDGCEHFACEPCAAEVHPEHDHEQHGCEHAEAQRQLQASIARGDPQPPESFHQLRRPTSGMSEEAMVMNVVALTMLNQEPSDGS